jgi:hypothetical protein
LSSENSRCQELRGCNDDYSSVTNHQSADNYASQESLTSLASDISAISIISNSDEEKEHIKLLQCIESFRYGIQECIEMCARNILMDICNFSQILPMLAMYITDSRLTVNDDGFPFDPGIFYVEQLLTVERMLVYAYE